ncbi:MAG: hypothetical protein KBT00_08150, partial [Bacteroidales bacterium]|nr:hypothetical protein [Candidatus Cacconaster merdequi]
MAHSPRKTSPIVSGSAVSTRTAGRAIFFEIILLFGELKVSDKNVHKTGAVNDFNAPVSTFAITK